MVPDRRISPESGGVGFGVTSATVKAVFVPVALPCPFCGQQMVQVFGHERGRTVQVVDGATIVDPLPSWMNMYTCTVCYVHFYQWADMADHTESPDA